jgi:hypothetical protein
MKYFRVTMDSTEMCGFTSHGYFKGLNEDEVANSYLFDKFHDEMIDYVAGWVTEEDLEENENAADIFYNIDEITEEEYLEGIGFYGEERPFSTG